MDQNSPCSESYPDCEIRPGEDIMDYLERHSKYMDERSEKSMAKLEALYQAIIGKFQEIEVSHYIINNALDGNVLRKPSHPPVPPENP